MKRSIVVVCVACAASLGCVATETGNPTLVEIDTTSVVGFIPTDDPPMPTPPPPRAIIDGAPGAVTPASGEVWGWDLESTSPPARAAVAADGSFHLEVPSLPNELIRLQVRTGDGGASTPFDVRVDPVEMMTLVSPANACLRMRPGTSIALTAAAGTEAVIVLENACTEPVARAPARLRAGNPRLALADDGRLTLAPGTSAEIRVRVADGAGLPEDIVLVVVESPRPELRAVNVVTR